jgi:hypothetical protein
MADWSKKHKPKKVDTDEIQKGPEKNENDFPLEDVYYMRIGSGYIHPSRSYDQIEAPVFQKFVTYINAYYEQPEETNQVVFEEIED